MSRRKYKAGDTIKLVIDKNILEQYNRYYFDKYPKRKVLPIAKPVHPSINAWIILKRPAMNSLKAKWKEFIIWFIKNEGLSELNIHKCNMEFISFLHTRIRADCDNLTPKFILDGFVEAQFIEDDDYLHLEAITLRCGYDKLNPRTEIIIHIL